MIVEMKLHHALTVAFSMTARARYEVLGVRADDDVEKWAIERYATPGISYALVEDGKTLAVMGVVASGPPHVGTVWLVAAEGWQKHVKQCVKLWKLILKSAGYRRLEALVYSDNKCALRMAEWAGLKFECERPAYTKRGETVAQFGMVLT